MSEDEIDLEEGYRKFHWEVIQPLFEKPSKWRIMYERTGRLDWKFYGEKKLIVRVEDICQSKKLKFANADKTVLNIKDSTNRLIFSYQSKKLRPLPCLANVKKYAFLLLLSSIVDLKIISK